MKRTARCKRKTRETEVSVRLDLDGEGKAAARTGVGMLDHMLETLAFHASFNLELEARGSFQSGAHHIVEDAAIALGLALQRALGNRQGLCRYGYACVPMDEALAEAAADLSGRGKLVLRAAFRRERVGGMATELVEDFFEALATRAGATLHLSVRYGRNDHHKIEALFKAAARALRQAVSRDPRQKGVPSTKGAL